MDKLKQYHYQMRTELDEKMKIVILKEAFQKALGYPLNLQNPKTFNEKIMWYKMYYQDPLLTVCADKYAVKEYVSQKIGKEHVIPAIGTWTDPDQIDFDKLPDRFVLKVNWSSGYNIFITDKGSMNETEVRAQLREWIRPDQNSYYHMFNWAYKHMKPIIFAEPYLEQADSMLCDYKFHMCAGELEFLLIVKDRYGDNEASFTSFDPEYRLLPFRRSGAKIADPLPEKPTHYEEMLQYARILAKEFPFVRVDFYEVGDQVLLGEMTFYPASGLDPFIPQQWDEIMGRSIPIPEKHIIDEDTISVRIKSWKKRVGLTAKQQLRKKVSEKMDKEHLTNNRLRRIRKTLIRRERDDNRKHVVLLGLRFPYETHMEQSEAVSKKYIHICGIEFCYKKTPLKEKPEERPEKISKTPEVNTNVTLYYSDNQPLTAFLMEPYITPDIQRIHCEQKAYKQLGYFPDLRNPKTLNEKMIWLALYYKNPEVSVVADKALVKQWIADRVGSEYVVPLIGVYTDVQDIDFDTLPVQFVAKSNNGWNENAVMIVRDKALLDLDLTKAVLSSWLYPWKDYYYRNMCVPRQKVERPIIIIEQYLDTQGAPFLTDYKFFCCNGEPRFAYVDERVDEKQSLISFVYPDWTVIPVKRHEYDTNPHPSMPKQVEKMIEISRELAKDFPLVRIDFYEIGDRLYVGEVTVFPGLFGKLDPVEWDRKLGDYLTLPDLNTLNDGLSGRRESSACKA